MEKSIINKEYGKGDNIFMEIFGSAAKYGGLMIGVYAMCKDEKEFGVAILGGAFYVAGNLFRDSTHDYVAKQRFSNLEQRFSNLEESLKEK